MTKLNKIPTLDGLRGYAALLVLWYHFPQFGFSKTAFIIHYLSGYFSAAYLGVDIFFCLSGFLITRILLTEKEKGDISFKRFYMKRALRIFPIYYLSIIIVGFVISWKDMQWVALYLSNYFFVFHKAPHPMLHTWSLAVEEHFYLLWPFVVYYFSREKAKKIISIIFPAFAVITAIIFMYFLGYQTAGDLMFRSTNCRMLTLSLGSILAFHEIKIRQISKRNFFLLFTAFLFVYLINLFSSKIPFLMNMNASFRFMIFSSLSSVLLLMFVLRLNYSSTALKSFFTNKISTYFGKISYGLYLYHFPILFFFGYTNEQTKLPIDKAFFPYGLLLLALCLAIPVLSFHLIEKPLLKFKDRFSFPVKDKLKAIS